MNEIEGICVFALFPSTTLKHLEVQSSNRRNNFGHCCVRFSSFVRQPFSKQLYGKHSSEGLLPYIDYIGMSGVKAGRVLISALSVINRLLVIGLIGYRLLVIGLK